MYANARVSARWGGGMGVYSLKGNRISWDSAGQPVVEMTKGASKGGSHKENTSLCPLGYGSCLCHQGLGGDTLS